MNSRNYSLRIDNFEVQTALQISEALLRIYDKATNSVYCTLQSKVQILPRSISEGYILSGMKIEQGDRNIPSMILSYENYDKAKEAYWVAMPRLSKRGCVNPCYGFWYVMSNVFHMSHNMSPAVKAHYELAHVKVRWYADQELQMVNPMQGLSHLDCFQVLIVVMLKILRWYKMVSKAQ